MMNLSCKDHNACQDSGQRDSDRINCQGRLSSPSRQRSKHSTRCLDRTHR